MSSSEKGLNGESTLTSAMPVQHAPLVELVGHPGAGRYVGRLSAFEAQILVLSSFELFSSASAVVPTTCEKTKRKNQEQKDPRNKYEI